MNDESLTIEINGQPVTMPLEQWDAVIQQVYERRQDDEEAWEAAERAACNVWTVDLCSCGFGGGDRTEDLVGLAEAVEELTWLEDHSDTSVLEIRDSTGTVVTLEQLRDTLAASLTSTAD